MKLTTMPWRLSALPAACAQVAHEALVGQPATRIVPASFGPARMRVAAVYGTSGSTVRTIGGKDIPVVNAQLTGDVRGVPPRGRPV